MFKVNTNWGTWRKVELGEALAHHIVIAWVTPLNVGGSAVWRCAGVTWCRAGPAAVPEWLDDMVDARVVRPKTMPA
jgi:hypothetical protein